MRYSSQTQQQQQLVLTSQRILSTSQQQEEASDDSGAVMGFLFSLKEDDANRTSASMRSSSKRRWMASFLTVMLLLPIISSCSTKTSSFVKAFAPVVAPAITKASSRLLVLSTSSNAPATHRKPRSTTCIFYRPNDLLPESSQSVSASSSTPPPPLLNGKKQQQPSYSYHGPTNLSFYEPSANGLWQGDGKDQHKRNRVVGGGSDTTADPSQIEFVAPQAYDAKQEKLEREEQDAVAELRHVKGHYYPFAWMLQGSARFIADHAGKTVVFHLPGELIESPQNKSLLQDIALCWLLGMKIVLVVAGRYNAAGECRQVDHEGHCGTAAPAVEFNNAHECHNTIKVVNDKTIRKMEEEAGYLRCEMERKLNRCLRSGIMHDMPEGNVVSGNNFYTAKPIGMVRNQDLQNLGFCTDTNVRSIRQVLQHNDVVLLNTVGVSDEGDMIQCNGYHLAAKVAADLGASKLIYMNNEKSVMINKKDRDDNGHYQPVQELNLSFAKQILDYHHVKVHNTGFATFQQARENLEGNALELLLHLGWGAWSLDHGVDRCHIVNPADGALLEELFTSKNGANTCLMQDEEIAEDEGDKLIAQEDWDDFFDDEQGQGVAFFG